MDPRCGAWEGGRGRYGCVGRVHVVENTTAAFAGADVRKTSVKIRLKTIK
jgi:hypothetical protein